MQDLRKFIISFLQLFYKYVISFFNYIYGI